MHMFRLRFFTVSFLSLILFSAAFSFAAPVSEETALTAAKGWFLLDTTPLGSKPVLRVPSVATPFYDDQSQLLYYVVNVFPKGVVIVSGDDRLTPVVAWLPQATLFDDSEENPLLRLLNSDIADRLQEVKAHTTRHSSKNVLWDTLLLEATAPATRRLETDPTDLRVAAFVQSQWSQESYAQESLYNYYTPNNYPCGCVATAMAQIMRYYQYPTGTIPVQSFEIKVDNTPTTATLRGGDGNGGAYPWQSMPLVPDASITTTQREAIGALTYDAGVSINMDYSQGGSGASSLDAANSLVGIFGYSNAIYQRSENSFNGEIENVINTNCDARIPTLLSVKDKDNSGHAIICDGYGYQISVLYHHINLGWGGYNDVWYNLPTVDTDPYSFVLLRSVVANIYTTGTGEIISGRVLDANNSPVEGVNVTASRDTGVVSSATTDSNGIYALTHVSSNTTFTVHAEKDGYTFKDQTATTGTSGYQTVGNVWGINFAPNDVPTPTIDAMTFLSTLLTFIMD